MISVRDIAWLAGLLEGEGCFNLSGSKNGSARISINMSDRDVIKRAADLFSTKVAGPYQQHKTALGKKPMYRTEIFSGRAAGWMMTLYPFLGKRRRTAVRKTLKVWRKQRLKNPNGAGRRNPRCESERKQVRRKAA